MILSDWHDTAGLGRVKTEKVNRGSLYWPIRTELMTKQKSSSSGKLDLSMALNAPSPNVQEYERKVTMVPIPIPDDCPLKCKYIFDLPILI